MIFIYSLHEKGYVVSLSFSPKHQSIQCHLSSSGFANMSYFVGDVEFISGKLDDCYKCVKCSQILHDPMQFPCGHR